jgi:hypothetical protein
MAEQFEPKDDKNTEKRYIVIGKGPYRVAEIAADGSVKFIDDPELEAKELLRQGLKQPEPEEKPEPKKTEPEEKPKPQDETQEEMSGAENLGAAAAAGSIMAIAYGAEFVEAMMALPPEPGETAEQIERKNRNKILTGFYESNGIEHYGARASSQHPGGALTEFHKATGEMRFTKNITLDHAHQIYAIAHEKGWGGVRLTTPVPEEDKIMLLLAGMNYKWRAAMIAIECGKLEPQDPRVKALLEGEEGTAFSHEDKATKERVILGDRESPATGFAYWPSVKTAIKIDLATDIGFMAIKYDAVKWTLNAQGKEVFKKVPQKKLAALIKEKLLEDPQYAQLVDFEPLGARGVKIIADKYGEEQKEALRALTPTSVVENAANPLPPNPPKGRFGRFYDNGMKFLFGPKGKTPAEAQDQTPTTPGKPSPGARPAATPA